ncbi:hypothetical protein KY290_021262 [Solanum tuberosum]|uniref:Endonuclease/exonuclease/phosphatase domain-containing protein n=1 Tax=Solanum tuberosum TaxID=4113 RepID=A0ABQ7V111_SOLTU|nr:hypothetical protein KY289_020433 [Solanum tuberosum]KAH0693090.1 hypothetical protein KY285_020187 [Solanum tuberosum]KAH0757769.1 hypothetical protein KY290_021262 [Solanum tuberosum]
MKVNIVSWNVRDLTDPRKRLLIKNVLHIWRADVYCFQESKLRGDIRETIKELWANRRVKFAQLEAVFLKASASRLWRQGEARRGVCAYFRQGVARSKRRAKARGDVELAMQ